MSTASKTTSPIRSISSRITFHLWQVHFSGRGKGIKAHDARELVFSFEEILPTGVQVMVQSIFVGPAANGRTVYAYVTERGDPLAALTTRKIRQHPIEFGRGTIAAPFRNPEFADLGLRFFRDNDYRGFGTIESKRDAPDAVDLLENSCHLAADAWADPEATFEAMAAEVPARVMEGRHEPGLSAAQVAHVLVAAVPGFKESARSVTELRGQIGDLFDLVVTGLRARAR